MQRMAPSRQSFHVSLAFLLGLLMCCNVEAEQVVIRHLGTGQRRRGSGRWTSANSRQLGNARQGSAQSGAFAGLYSKRLRTICADVECPVVEEEERAGPGIELRKYQASEWVAYGNDHWKFKNIATNDYKEHFMRLIDYQLKNNLLETKLPMTTPIIHEMTAIKKYTDPTSGSIDLDEGFTLRIRIHSKHQGDPGASPTEKLMNVAPWTPTSTGWVAVHQFKMKFEEGPEPKEHYEKLRKRLRAKLAKAGAEDLDPPYEKFYFVLWGSPANRLYEIWLPVNEAVASVLMKP